MEKRTRNVLFASILFFSVLGSLFAYNWINYQNLLDKFQACEENHCLRIYGNVQTEVFIGKSYLLNDTFERVENVTYQQINMYNNTAEYNVSGVKLWNILEELEILTTEAQYFQFQASDGYKTYQLPIEIIQNYPDEILIVTHIDGEIIPPKEEGGDGPLKVAVPMEALIGNAEVQAIFDDYNQPFVHNSKFAVKYLSMIEIF